MAKKELNESILGTQEYWDNRYQSEVDNFRNHGDIGEIWFGEESVNRICKWILKNPDITKDKRIIDLGCGNGLFLVQLAQNNFKNLLGVDYSKDAIILANEVAKKENVTITYKVSDILCEDTGRKFDIVHDKGTYDAISLSSNAHINRQKYIDKVYSILENSGLFIITSCNWTKEELIEHFTSLFNLLHVIPTPQFTFGGQTGNTVTPLVFQKNVCY